MTMFLSKDSDLPSDIITNDDSAIPSDVTKACSSEPIKILVFPPKNKQFRFHEDTNKIEIQPIEPPFEQNVGFNSVENKSSLTPLVEKCNISIDVDVSCQSTPIITHECRERELSVKPILKIEKAYNESRLGKNCFLKGCKWSVDGLCLLTNSEDNVLRLFDIPGDFINNPQNDINPVLQIKEGGTIYDYSWYPYMNSSDPVSCVFASTSQDSPIHLWDAYTGQLRATYQPINQYDEVTSAYSLAFSPDGLKIYSGFKKCLRIFDISQPGRISEERNLKIKGNHIYQSNIISTISINPFMPSLYALGSYDKTVGIYSEPEGDLICVLKGHSGGITQIMFSSNGNYLFSGGRKDDEILCWDIRNPGKIVFSIAREVDTQQKIQFDLSPDQEYLVTGNTDCSIKIYNVNSPSSTTTLQPAQSWKAHEDCVNGVHFHPTLPVFASSSGQRHLPGLGEDEDDQTDPTIENSIKLWSYSL